MRRHIPFWTPQVGLEAYEFLQQVLESNFLNDGQFTTRFEEQLAKSTGARHVIAVTSGTAALYLALVACGVGHGDEVLIPDVTFIATANAVTMTGATPVLVDIDPDTLNIDSSLVVGHLTPRTRAVMPVHISGRPAKLDALLEISQRKGIPLIEDAAEGLGSRHDGRCLGTIGLAGCISLSPNKTISTGQGGAVLTNDDALAARVRELKDQGRPFRGTGGSDVHPRVGYNFKFTDLQAAVGLAQLRHLSARLDRLRSTYRIYSEELAEVRGIRVLDFHLDGGEAPQWIDAIADRRDELDQYLLQKGIQCRRFWFPLHWQLPYRQPPSRFPVASAVTPNAIWLPSAFTLSDDDVRVVCDEIRKFYRQLDE